LNRRLDGGMTHHLLHHLRVLSTLEHQRREGVSEVVEAQGGGEACAFDQRLAGAGVDIVAV
jgi:hypothetical protein